MRILRILQKQYHSQYHSHSASIFYNKNTLSNSINTNNILSNLLQEVQKQNKLLENINDNIITQNQSLSYFMIYIMENQEK